MCGSRLPRTEGQRSTQRDLYTILDPTGSRYSEKTLDSFRRAAVIWGQFDTEPPQCMNTSE